jgi:hypothetical protein
MRYSSLRAIIPYANGGCGGALSEVLEDIKQRCEAAGIEYEDQGSLAIRFPWGNETYVQFVEVGPHAEWVASQPFEDYLGLTRYEASWSSKHRVIECDLVQSDARGLSASYTEQRLIRDVVRYLRQMEGSEAKPEELGPEAYREHMRERLRELEQDYEASLGQRRWEPPPEPSDEAERIYFEPVNGQSISIGHSSSVHSFVLGNHGNGTGPEGEIVADIGRSLTLRIEGTDVSNHEDAVELLERIGNALMFQIDMSYELGLTLERERPWRHVNPVWERTERKEPEPLPPIRFQYAREAMSLYWYAKAAADMPLLQFLAYYQIIEFYFPKYSHSRALTTIRNVLKDPRFDALRDTDVMRIFEAIRVNSKGRFRPESQQLGAAIEHCVQPEELQDFLFDEDRYDFYDSEHQTKVANKKIHLRGPLFDFPKDVATRIYEIRCQIVHTKSGYDEEPLLPFDPEIRYLRFDVDLIQFLARKVLIDASYGHPL